MQISPSLTAAVSKPQADRSIASMLSRQMTRLTQAGPQPAPGVQTTADGKSVPNAPTGGPVQPAPGSLDLDKFFAAWGTDNPEFDLTKDGIVDGADLGLLLAGVQPPSVADTPPETPIANDPTSSDPVTMQDVLAAWGQTGGAADLNGDGIVDGADLGIALAGMQPTEMDQLIAGVQKAWGSDDETYDLNKDGIVDGADLGIALSGAPYTPPANEPINEPINEPVDDETKEEPVAPTGQPTTESINGMAVALADAILTARGDASGEATDRQRLIDGLTRRFEAATAATPDVDLRRLAAEWFQSLVTTPQEPGDPRTALARDAYSDRMSAVEHLHKRLAANGFERTPPTNLDRIVGGLAPDRAARAALLRGLAARYPEGLGVNARA